MDIPSSGGPDTPKEDFEDVKCELCAAWIVGTTYNDKIQKLRAINCPIHCWMFGHKCICGNVEVDIEKIDRMLSSFDEESTEVLKQMANKEQRLVHLLNKWELVNKFDEEVDDMMRWDMDNKKRAEMMKDFKVTCSIGGKKLKLQDMITAFQQEMNNGFPRWKKSLMSDAERMAVKYANETPEERRKRQDNDAESHARARANETPEERRKRQDNDAESHGRARANETPEERRKRQDNDAESHGRARVNETPEERSKRQDNDAESHGRARANETPEERRKRQDNDAESHGRARANETPEKRSKRQDEDSDRHNSSRFNGGPPPTENTKVYETPCRDYVFHRHTYDITTAKLLFLVKCGSWSNYLVKWLGAYVFTRDRLMMNHESVSKVKRLDELYLWGVKFCLPFTEVVDRVFTRQERREAYRHMHYVRREESREVNFQESLLEWFADGDGDTLSLDDRKAKLPKTSTVEAEKMKKWMESLISLRLNVPNFWFKDTETGKQLQGDRLWPCEIEDINLEDATERYFIIKCTDEDDPYPIDRYKMAYVDVKKYVDRKQCYYRSFFLPEKLYRGWVDEKLFARRKKTYCNYQNASCDKQGDILYHDAINELIVYFNTHELTPSREKTLANKYYKSQGIGLEWAPSEMRCGKYETLSKEKGRVSAPLLTCACCGVRNLMIDDNPCTYYTKVDLQNQNLQKVLRLGDECTSTSFPNEIPKPTQESHRSVMENRPISIPYNDAGETKEVELWKLCSVWPALKPDELIEQRESLPDYLFSTRKVDGVAIDEPIYYHLHPEFVDEEINKDSKKSYTTTICLECKKSIDAGEVPRNSLAAGIDFGDANRIGLEPLTDRERQIISKVRHYLLVIKIESNIDYNRTKEKGQSAVKGCGIYFDDDSSRVVSDLLSQDGINGDVSLQFVGPDGEYDSLAKKVLGSANVHGRAWVIYQWLKVLREVNCHYQYDGELPNFEEVKAELKKANDALVDNAEHVNDECVLRDTEINKDDARHIRTSGGEDKEMQMEIDDEGVGETNGTNDFSLKCSLITSSTKSAKALDTDTDLDYLKSALESLGTKEDDKKSVTNKARRRRDPLNEYDCGDEAIAKGSPDVYLFGYAYGNRGPTLFNNEIRHLILQYTTAAACNRPLLFQLFESKWRHGVIGGMHAKVASNPEGFEQFAKEFASEEFHGKMKAAVEHPNGRDAKYVLSKLSPLLTFAGRKSVFGAFERRESASQILALGRRFGCAPNFLTFGIDDINHPNAIRFALRGINNHDFPAVVSSASDVELKHGIKLKEMGEFNIPFSWGDRFRLMINNPVGAAIAYKQVVHDIMTILIGLKPSNYSGNNNKVVATEFDDESFGIAGSPWAFFGKTETTGSGSLHFHVVVWAGLPPWMLDYFASNALLCKHIASVLDSIYCAELSRHDHIRDLVKKNIKHIKGLQTKKLSCAPPVHLPSDSDTLLSGKCCWQMYYCVVYGSLKDYTVPGAFATYSSKLKHECKDTSCQGKNCDKQKSMFHNEARAMLKIPDPDEDRGNYKTYVAITVCYCGNIHSHSFTCKKPPKGWHGCRLCYPKYLINFTKPVELVSDIQPDGSINWEELDSLVNAMTPVSYPPYYKKTTETTENTITQESVGPYNPNFHQLKQNMYPLPSDCSRTVIWELKRPEFTPLKTLNDDMSKDEILSRLYKEMSLNQENNPLIFERSGCDKLKMDQIDMHEFNKHDKNNLFYSLLLGLVKSLQIEPGVKSVACLRGELMSYLRKLELGHRFGDWTVKQYITSRMLDLSGNVGNENEMVKCYSNLMMNIGGDRCYQGGELEIYLFAEMEEVNVVVYTESGGELTHNSSASYNAKGMDRPIIYLLRRQKKVVADDDGIIKPPTFSYTLFTPKLKNIIDKLQVFDADDLVTLTKLVSSKLRDRNGWVVDFNRLLTGLLGSNTNLLHLGSTEQCKSALYYIGPYINKDGVKITDALPILLKAHEHTLMFPSVAKDADTDKRRAQHTLTRTVNKLNNLIEVTDTQAASSLLLMGASLCSESFVNCDTKQHEKYIDYELNRCADVYGCANDDDGSVEEEDTYYNEEDILLMGEEMEIGEADDKKNVEYDDLIDIDKDSRKQLALNRRKFQLNQKEQTLDENLNYMNASFGGSFLFRKNDGSKQPVSPPALYRYRGKELKHLNRYMYTALIKVESKSNSNNKQGSRESNRQFEFSDGLGIEQYHCQVLRSKQCTPKFWSSPPAIPKAKPRPVGEDNNDNDKKYMRELSAWEERANRFAHYYLTMFRSEDKLYASGQTNTYKYDYEAFKEFYEDLTISTVAEDWLTLQLMESVMYSWRVDSNRREMLAAHRARSRTLWTAEEKEAAKSFYGKAKATRDTDSDGMDHISSIALDLSLREMNNGRKHLRHSQDLIDTLDELVDQPSIPNNQEEGEVDTNIQKAGKLPHPNMENQSITNVTICPFDSVLDDSKRTPVSNCEGVEEETQPKMPSRFHKVPDLNEKLKLYIEGLKLSPDKNIAVNLVRDHFEAICSGRAEDQEYKALNLMICGKPGNGKSKIIEAFEGMAEIMKAGELMKCAYMGAAAVNIVGTTLLKSWDIPVFKTNECKKFRKWDLKKLQALKRRFGQNIYNICAVIVDEVSTLQPYMLAYLNDRMQEMFQNNKPFGGRMVILLGDFQQKPPTAGGKRNTLPGSVMSIIEKKGKPLTKALAEQYGPTQVGGYLFSRFRYIELTHQHRSDDPQHTSVLNKMSDSGSISVSDLRVYKELSAIDLASDDFRFATIIVTGNDERRKINAWQAERWAKYYGVNIVRWARIRKEETWRGKPRTEACIAHAMQNSCFWEYFIPGAKGYLNTHNINGDEGLANGTEIKYHSLSFENRDQEKQFKRQLVLAEPDDVISIDASPISINVELFADFDEDTTSERMRKVKMRKEWIQSGKGSVIGGGRVVIPISRQDGSQITFKTNFVQGGRPLDLGPNLYYSGSQLEMKDHFPVEPAFSITNDKAQGKTIHRIVLSISEHLFHLNKMTWEGLFVSLSRVRKGDHMRLLIKGGDWGTLRYVSKLKRNEYTDWFFAGYVDHPSKDGSKVWNHHKARREAGLDGKKIFGKEKKKKRKGDEEVGDVSRKQRKVSVGKFALGANGKLVRLKKG